MILGKDILTLDELTGAEIVQVIELAHKLKQERKRGHLPKLLAGRSLAMIFQKPSTRTRVSFEVGMFELGGHALNLGATELQLARGESIEDTARTLSRYADLIMARVYAHSDVARLAEGAAVPVINGLSDAYHPCQILADLLTIWEARGRLEGLHLTWVGDGNNVCNTLLVGSAKVGLNMAVATPPPHSPSAEAVRLARAAAQSTGARLSFTDKPEEAVQGADVVVTDTFVSMGMDKEREERLRLFLPRYQVTEALMARAKPDAIFMHCLPAHRGEEVVDAVIDGPHSVVFDEAENRLHAQKALMCTLLREPAEIAAALA
jgi:ornithine carbamoyltransferase